MRLRSAAMAAMAALSINCSPPTPPQAAHLISTPLCSAIKGNATVYEGLIAIKKGMTASFNQWGQRVPLTVLQVVDNQVVAQRIPDGKVYKHHALQIGAVNYEKPVTKPLLGMFAALSLPVKQKLAEFRVTPDCLMPVGTQLGARHFVPGQYVDVTGVSIGKGFQGGMKRHGFKGLPASHGTSVSHRSIGSTGQRKQPSRVFKGKKMPGHMGEERVTTQGLQIFRIDGIHNFIFVKGHVPGGDNRFVLVKDAIKKVQNLPVPTVLAAADGSESVLKEFDMAPQSPNNPWKPVRQY